MDDCYTNKYDIRILQAKHYAISNSSFLFAHNIIDSFDWFFVFLETNIPRAQRSIWQWHASKCDQSHKEKWLNFASLHVKWQKKRKKKIISILGSEPSICLVFNTIRNRCFLCASVSDMTKSKRQSLLRLRITRHWNKTISQQYEITQTTSTTRSVLLGTKEHTTCCSPLIDIDWRHNRLYWSVTNSDNSSRKNLIRFDSLLFHFIREESTPPRHHDTP